MLTGLLHNHDTTTLYHHLSICVYAAHLFRSAFLSLCFSIHNGDGKVHFCASTCCGHSKQFARLQLPLREIQFTYMTCTAHTNSLSLADNNIACDIQRTQSYNVQYHFTQHLSLTPHLPVHCCHGLENRKSPDNIIHSKCI